MHRALSELLLSDPMKLIVLLVLLLVCVGVAEADSWVLSTTTLIPNNPPNIQIPPKMWDTYPEEGV